MPTAFTHCVVALALAKAIPIMPLSTRFWVYSVLVSILPDIDVIAFSFGIPYEHVLGHRGITHSLPFAVLVGIVVTMTMFYRQPREHGRRLIFIAYFSIVTASHGLLDAMTNGGLGVAFFAPFDETRYFLPWRPMTVSPIGIAAFFSQWGWRTLVSEILWVWLPVTIAVSLLIAVNRIMRLLSTAESVKPGQDQRHN